VNGETSISILNLMDVSDEKKTYDEALRFVSKIQINSNLLNEMKSLTESIFNKIQNDVSEALRIFSGRC
jgi:Mg2+ and Co2+ transporter CorA